MPRPGRGVEGNAKYCLLFFRPWTLVSEFACPDVLHITNLGNAAQQGALADLDARTARRRAVGKQQDRTVGVAPRLNFAAAWENYIRGSVVSKHAQRLITQLLLNTMARNAGDDEDHDEADPSDEDLEIPKMV